MDRSTLLARALFEHYQHRNWTAARELVNPDAVLEMPATGERLEGLPALIALPEKYPEP
jgi:hypothetical protein